MGRAVGKGRLVVSRGWVGLAGRGGVGIPVCVANSAATQPTFQPTSPHTCSMDSSVVPSAACFCLRMSVTSLPSTPPTLKPTSPHLQHGLQRGAQRSVLLPQDVHHFLAALKQGHLGLTDRVHCKRVRVVEVWGAANLNTEHSGITAGLKDYEYPPCSLIPSPLPTCTHHPPTQHRPPGP